VNASKMMCTQQNLWRKGMHNRTEKECQLAETMHAKQYSKGALCNSPWIVACIRAGVTTHFHGSSASSGLVLSSRTACAQKTAKLALLWLPQAHILVNDTHLRTDTHESQQTIN